MGDPGLFDTPGQDDYPSGGVMEKRGAPSPLQTHCVRVPDIDAAAAYASSKSEADTLHLATIHSSKIFTKSFDRASMIQALQGR